jgi:hypothetical protein
MWRNNVVALPLLACAVCFCAEPPSIASLPAGDMQKKAHTACTTCHDSNIIVQQRLSKAAWTKEVDKMVKWGAILNPSDRDPLIEYFSTNFPPEKTPYLPPRSARAKH